MKIKNEKMYRRDILFLLFYCPLFFLKLLNITVEDAFLIITAIFCSFFLMIIMITKKYSRREILTYIVLCVVFSLITVCSGKEGALFSLLMILALIGSNQKKYYKFLMIIAVFGTLCSAFMLVSSGGFVGRYINGDWKTVFKRSNILYISFFTCIGIFTLIKKNTIKLWHLIVISIAGYGMYKYSGSRTGLVILIIYVLLVLFLRFKTIRKNRVVKWILIVSPAFCFILSYIVGALYGNNSYIQLADAYMQGRIRQNNIFIDTYTPRLFGQRIFESLDARNFLNLDNAYMDMFLCYGVLFSAIWLIITTLVVIDLYKQDRYAEVVLIVAYSVYGLSETFLPNCFLNMSIFLYAEYMDNEVRRKKEKRHHRYYKIKEEF